MIGHALLVEQLNPTANNMAGRLEGNAIPGNCFKFVIRTLITFVHLPVKTLLLRTYTVHVS